MANSFDSGDGGAAAEVQRSLVETTVASPSQGELQSSKGSGTFTPAGTADAFDNSENNGEHGVVQESNAYDAILAEKLEMGVQELEEHTAATKEEHELVKCSEKCVSEVHVIDDTEPVETSIFGHGEFNNGGDGSKKNRKQQEPKEKKPRGRGGKARRNNVILSCYSNKRKQKKGLQYSRGELEALRFENLEEQNKKSVEVYCGFGPMVAQEYDSLAELYKGRQEDSVPGFDFDPRLQSQKSANLGEECPQFADNHLENLGTSDPSSFVLLVMK